MDAPTYNRNPVEGFCNGSNKAPPLVTHFLQLENKTKYKTVYTMPWFPSETTFAAQAEAIGDKSMTQVQVFSA